MSLRCNCQLAIHSLPMVSQRCLQWVKVGRHGRNGTEPSVREASHPSLQILPVASQSWLASAGLSWHPAQCVGGPAGPAPHACTPPAPSPLLPSASCSQLSASAYQKQGWPLAATHRAHMCPSIAKLCCLLPKDPKLYQDGKPSHHGCGCIMTQGWYRRTYRPPVRNYCGSAPASPHACSLPSSLTPGPGQPAVWSTV